MFNYHVICLVKIIIHQCCNQNNCNQGDYQANYLLNWIVIGIYMQVGWQTGFLARPEVVKHKDFLSSSRSRCSYFCSNYICPFAYPLSILCINSQRISSLIIQINRPGQVNGNRQKMILKIFMTFFQFNLCSNIQNTNYKNSVW